MPTRTNRRATIIEPAVNELDRVIKQADSSLEHVEALISDCTCVTTRRQLQVAASLMEEGIAALDDAEQVLGELVANLIDDSEAARVDEREMHPVKRIVGIA